MPAIEFCYVLSLIFYPYAFFIIVIRVELLPTLGSLRELPVIDLSTDSSHFPPPELSL